LEIMQLGFLPSFPLTFSYPLLFGALLVAGMIGGEVARTFRLPRILGYGIVGFLCAPFAQALGLELLIDEARIFVNLALGLVLFDLGRRFDLQWMKRDWTLAATAGAESVLSFAAVLATLLAFQVPLVDAGLAAAIAMTTSPAMLLFTVHETRAEGQVTERAMSIVAMNGLLASIITTMMVASSHLAQSPQVEVALLHPLYLFFGSLALGAAMSWLTRVIARNIEKSKDVHFTLIVGMVVGAVGLATMLKLPVILTLLAFGIFSRNDDRGYELLNVNLAPLGRLLYIVLFVITGASVPMEALATGGMLALLFLVARGCGKLVGVLAVAPLGGLRMRQCLGLALALQPMSALTLLMAHDIGNIFPSFGHRLGDVFIAAVIVMEIAGPLCVQGGLRLAGETVRDDAGSMTLPPRAARTRSA
jgi:Kef-type K+ transport system membrane component KefB